ncbi:unnamed protein product [Caenorhabditis sp. 36 PRJEB53466]|nr:unnamed protein product [Caenorhabditis sp. 36 PRJEB53466]
MSADKDDLLTAKLAPKKREELQIHNKKLGELAQWLKNAFPSKYGGLPCALFLTGPTGSGKSTAVEVLCKENNVEVIDYTPELLYNEKMEHEKPDSSQLIRFLSRRHGSLTSCSRKRLLLVTELPDQSYHDAEKFREELAEAFQSIWHPVIFCLSNEVAIWKLNPMRLFTEVFLQKNGVDFVSFNSVADTFMKKAIRRASNLLNYSLSEAKLNVLAEEARGDLRMAMNMLQMNTIGRNTDRQSGTKMICAAKANKEEAFHMIGRILYAKRVNPNAPKPSRNLHKKRKSAPIPEPKERTELEHEPTDIIAMSSMSSDKLVSFLFENEPFFCSDMAKYRRVTDSFSLCDAMTAKVAVRSVMWNNYKCERPRTLFCVHRPILKDLEKSIQTTQCEMQRLPIVGVKYFSSLTAPYSLIIKKLVDPHRMECFLSRPMSISWKYGRDQIDEQIEKKLTMHNRYRPKKLKAEKEKLESEKEEEEEEEEEEKFTIEEWSDDSFDEM